MPLTITARLMAGNAVTGLVFSFIRDSLGDRVGRKWIIVISLAFTGIGYVVLNVAATLAAFALIMAISGALNPLSWIGWMPCWQI